MPHGDLLAIDPSLPRSLAQPRTVRFVTDSIGYRNDEDYASEPLVIVGDSLIAGTGNDQEALLANVLRRELGVESYALAFPTDPGGYFGMVEEFLRQARPPFRVLVFVFEGNDFHGPGRGLAKPGRYDAAKLRALGYLNSVVLKASFYASRRLQGTLWPRLDSETEVYQVGARPMAFYGSYIDKAVADSLRFEPGAPSLEVLGRVEGVFFIPTKYRVYFSLLDDRRGRRLPSPPPGVLALRAYFEKHGIPVMDLTGPLVEAATELLQTDEYVFWRDDTHWNERGVRVAAKEVASFLERGR
jgi:hypothetical protein